MMFVQSVTQSVLQVTNPDALPLSFKRLVEARPLN